MTNQFQKEILDKIKAGEVVQRSHAHFVLKSALWIFGTVLTLGLALFFVSFIVFVLRGNGAFFAARHLGGPGVFILIRSLPWILIILVVVILFILELLSKHFAFVYKRPLVQSLLAIVVVVITLGALLGSTNLHDRAARRTFDRGLPIAGMLYELFGEGKLDDRLHPGMIKELTEVGFIIEDREGEIHEVMVTTRTKRPPELIFKIGMRIMVVGEEGEDDVITARGVHPIDREHSIFGPPGHRPPRDREGEVRGEFKRNPDFFRESEINQ